MILKTNSHYFRRQHLQIGLLNEKRLCSFQERNESLCEIWINFNPQYSKSILATEFLDVVV